MLNVTPLLSINSSIQTSWGPRLWPCTPPAHLAEAGEACLVAHSPHLTTGLSHMDKQRHTHTVTHSLSSTHTHIQRCTYRSMPWQWALSLQKMSMRTYLWTHKHNAQVHLPPCSPVHRAIGRLCSIPLKVLWAVISKTIPWMAALIENNEGHIEHMVAVESPFPPSSLLFSLSLCVSLSLPKSLRQKVQSNFATAKQRSVWLMKKERTLSKLFFFSFWQVNVYTVCEKGNDQPIG